MLAVFYNPTAISFSHLCSAIKQKLFMKMNISECKMQQNIKNAK
jgi:hypothetical protein